MRDQVKTADERDAVQLLASVIEELIDLMERSDEEEFGIDCKPVTNGEWFPAIDRGKKALIHTRRMSEAQRKAKCWRDDNGYSGKGGVIVICGDVVQGWANELRDPQHWIPGCIAVAEDGRCHEARGGNDYGGAECWHLCA